MYEKQGWHYLILVGLLAGVAAVVNDSILFGRFLGISTPVWLIVAIVVPIVHQVYVWFVWRAELHYSLISGWFGKNGFMYYAVGFSILFISRFLSIIALAIANRNTLALHPLIAYVIAVVLLMPVMYLFYSVQRYFGFKRAYGIDHFDKAFHAKPFVKQGIFRFTENGMYVFGFLVLWVPGFLLLSKAALLAALFNHLYIWVHYYCTELPDIRRIYGEGIK